MADAIGKLITAFVDALTPKWIRVLLLACVVGLGYVQWSDRQTNEDKHKEQDAKISSALVSMASVDATTKAMLQAQRDGNDAVTKLVERIDRLADRR